jgi:hypothetical protein
MPISRKALAAWNTFFQALGENKNLADAFQGVGIPKTFVTRESFQYKP